jgi:DNA-directed RNA polymerase subunit RPC12/RpoP
MEFLKPTLYYRCNDCSREWRARSAGSKPPAQCRYCGSRAWNSAIRRPKVVRKFSLAEAVLLKARSN